MSDPLVSERQLAYFTPAMHSSKDSLTKFQTDYPTTSLTEYKEGGQFTINLKSAGQTTFVDPNNSWLCFTARFTVDAADAPATGLALSSAGDPSGNNVSGMPCFLPGAPMIESCSVSVPGLNSSDLSLLTRNDQSQVFYMSRLLSTAAGTGIMTPARQGTFHIPGLPEMAGAKSIFERGAAADGSVRIAFGTTAASNQTVKSAGINYCIPLSQVCPLFNKASAFLPLSYLCSGGDAMSFSFQLAGVKDTVHFNSAAVKDNMSYSVIDPKIISSQVSIYDASQLAEIQRAYRGLRTAILGEGVSMTVPMNYSYIGYRQGPATRVPAQQGSFTVSIPADHPSVLGLAVRLCPRQPVPESSRYLTYDKVVWKSLQLRVASTAYPSQPVRNIQLLGVDSAAAGDDAKLTDCTDAELYVNYHRARHLFDPYDAPAYTGGVLSTFCGMGSSTNEDSLSSHVLRGGDTGSAGAPPDGAVDTHPNLVLFDLESMCPDMQYSSSEDAHAMRGIDLRGVSTITLSGEFEVRARGSLNPSAPASNTLNTDIYTTLAVNECVRVSPGRIDANHVFALAPSS